MALDKIPNTTLFIQRDVRETPTTVLTAAEAVPIGAILPWLKSFTNTPSLPTGFVECDGSVLSDADSVYNGETLPDLNGNEFVRGAATSGGTGGGTTGAGSAHGHDVTGTSAAGSSHNHSFSDGFTTSGPSTTDEGASGTGQIMAADGHTHTGTASGTTGGESSHTHADGTFAAANESSHTHSSAPKFYDVVWIMRIK